MKKIAWMNRLFEKSAVPIFLLIGLVAAAELASIEVIIAYAIAMIVILIAGIAIKLYIKKTTDQFVKAFGFHPNRCQAVHHPFICKKNCQTILHCQTRFLVEKRLRDIARVTCNACKLQEYLHNLPIERIENDYAYQRAYSQRTMLEKMFWDAHRVARAFNLTSARNFDDYL